MGERNQTLRDPKKYWLDQPKNSVKLIWLLIIVCAALFLADFAYHKHSHFGVEDVFGFYALFSFAAGIGLVLVARLLRALVQRDEEYYDKDE